MLLAAIINTQAQEATKIDVMGKNMVTVNEDSTRTEVILINKRIEIQDNYNSDTTTIRVGNKNIEIVEGDKTTTVDITRDNEWRNDRKENREKNFNGHWAGFEMGVNSFYNEDYSLYGNDQFMELKYPKSMEVNINFLEYNISLKKERLGIVTGMGWSMKNYKFDNRITIENINGMIEPVLLDPDNLEKSKLTVSYLNVPLLLEFQVPVNNGSNQLFISGGVIGGININSHTKVKYNNSKTKDHGSFNINPFQYAVTTRIGLKDVALYGTYSLSPLFKDKKGPELFPFSIGISLINM